MKWISVLTVGNLMSSDGRELVTEGGNWRTLPLPLMMLDETSQGHEGAKFVGNIETIEVRGNEFIGTGSFDDSELGQLAEKYVKEQKLRWISIDPEVMESELIVYDEAGNRMAEEEITDENVMSIKIVERYLKWNIMGATIVPFPAFPQAVIAPEGADLGKATELGREAAEAAGEVSVLACGMKADPPSEWFSDPQLDDLTALSVTDEGRIYGHAAGWKTRHIGFANRSITPPHSLSDYAHFRTGLVKCADGAELPVGPITLGTGHAGATASARNAAEHYDDTGTAVADVAVGEDAHGIWIAGALRPGVTSEQIRILRASALSGDWRSVGGNLELVALLAVNTPGFGIPRTTAGIVEDRQTSLVAAGIVAADPLAALTSEVKALRAALKPLLPLAGRRIADRLK